MYIFTHVDMNGGSERCKRERLREGEKGNEKFKGRTGGSRDADGRGMNVCVCI
jgi:hypothetical protein